MSSEIREVLAKHVHDSWLEERKRQGYLPPVVGKCPICNEDQIMTGDKTIIFCPQGHPFKTHCRMIPYDQLSSEDKAYDRATVNGLLEGLGLLGYDIVQSKTGYVVKL